MDYIIQQKFDYPGVITSEEVGIITTFVLSSDPAEKNLYCKTRIIKRTDITTSFAIARLKKSEYLNCEKTLKKYDELKEQFDNFIP